MTRSVLSVALGIALCAACASKSFKEPGVRSVKSQQTHRTFSSSYGKVWKATVAALEANKYTIAESRRDKGMIETDWLTGKSDRLYSGYGDTRIPYSIRYRFTLILRPIKQGIKIKIRSNEQYLTDAITAGMDFDGSLYRWIPTKSSGAKESDLLKEVAYQLLRGQSSEEQQ